VIVFQNGKLVDGSHRCHAVIRAGLPIEVAVWRPTLVLRQ
jgi:hypothetical protein